MVVSGHHNLFSTIIAWVLLGFHLKCLWTYFHDITIFVVIIFMDFSNRGSHRRCSAKKGVLENYENFTRKRLCWSLFLTKLQVKKRPQDSCFTVKFAKYLRTPILKNICEWLLLYWKSLVCNGYNSWNFPHISEPKFCLTPVRNSY